MSGDGKLNRMEKDYESIVDRKLQESDLLASNGNVNDAIELLISLEKQTRVGCDTMSTTRLLKAIITLCYKYKQYDMLNENIILLSKRRGQIPQATTKMIQEAFSYIKDIQDEPTKLKLIETLRLVTDGKIYVEVERARLTRILADILERDGNIDKAGKVMVELQVETFGSMEKQEKIEFLLDQMRLSLLKKDYVIAQIISKKISPKFFKDKENAAAQLLKLKFYNQMVQFNLHDSNYLQVCRHYFAIYDTPSIQESTEKRHEADLLARVDKLECLPKDDLYKDILKEFTTDELIDWLMFENKFGKFLTTSLPGNVVFPQDSVGKTRWSDIKSRNIRVMSKYYTQISIKRMASLLMLSYEDTEKCVGEVVSQGQILAKMDRLESVVHFTRPKSAVDVLNDWSNNLVELMKMLAHGNHLITKEQMVYKMF